MIDTPANEGLSGYLTVGEAARFLGVSPWTLRNWDKAGKLKTLRHPKNGYRIYRHEDLQAIQPEGLLARRFAPQVDYSQVGASEHFVQFYETDAFLVSSVSDYLAEALERGDGAVAIATRAHRRAIRRKLRARGLDLAAIRAADQCAWLDAAETLASFMVDGLPDPDRFQQVIGSVLAQVSQGRSRVRAFGEMVALLWAQGNRQGAIRLEALWNELQETRAFSLFCAYPIGGFGIETDGAPFQEICTCHSRVIPAESYGKLPTEDERVRQISLLQQKAQALAAEVAHRQQIEDRLVNLQQQQAAELAELKRTQQSLVASEQYLQAVVETTPECVLSLDADGLLLSMNAAGLAMIEADGLEQVRGMPVESLIAADDRGAFRDFNQRICAGEHGTMEFDLLGLRGTRRRLETHAVPLRNPVDGSVAHLAITRDVTQRKRAEAELLEADRRKDEFLAVLAHELRNPLAPVRNALQIMGLAGDNRLAVEQARAMMERQVHQMVRLVDDLLDVSRITRGKMELKKERVALSSIVASAVETSRPLLEAGRHDMTVSLPPESLELDADPTRLAQVLANLLNNAAKYTDPGGKIWLTAARGGNRVLISVRDTGIGIPPELLPRVFEMFSQAERSLDRAQGGLGVGLTLVRTLVEMHGGRVEARSEGFGRGSEFIVHLPLAAAAPPAAGTSGELDGRAQRLGMRRILVVDDNVDAAESLAMLLRMLGQDVRTAHEARTALEVARQFHPDTAFLDIGLPGMSGYELAGHFRGDPSQRGAYLVALTGWGQEEDRRMSLEAGFDQHMTKPVDPKVLQEILARA